MPHSRLVAFTCMSLLVVADAASAQAPANPRRGEIIKRFDKDGDGKLSAEEEQAARAEMQRRKKGQGKANARPGEVIAKAALEERRPEQLQVGDVAPDFTLSDMKGERTITLSEFRGKKPVVLVFGSITCSPFRREVEQVEKLYQQYKDRVEFVMIYIREAHPDSVLYVPQDAAEVLRQFSQTNTLDDRTHNAEQCVAKLHLTIPTVVDRPDNKVNAAYSGWPIKLVIVDTDGRIADPGAPGPSGFKPEVIEQWLKANVKSN